MKIKSLLIGMLACSAMVACTNTDEPEVDNGSANGNEYYVSVAFSMPGNSSRAAALGDFEDAANNNEIDVKNAVFYFLNDAGISVADACYVPNVDDGFTWDTQVKAEANDNVNALTNSVIVMRNPTEIPSRIVAIVNVGDLPSQMDKARPTLAELQGVVNCYTGTDYTSIHKNGMIMSSTSYYDANNKLMIGAPVAASNIFESSSALNMAIKQASTEDMAKVAVIIPVEKVLAKVTVSEKKKDDGTSAMTQTGTTLESLTSAGATAGAATTKAENVTLTVSIDGWWLDSTPTQSYLLKNMCNFAVTGTWWNDIANTRSYWATSYAGSDPAQAYANDKYGHQVLLDGSLYTQENTSMADERAPQNSDGTNDNVYDTNNRTKVVVAATLKQGANAVDLVKWYGNYYTKDGFLISLANLSDVKKYYTKSTVEGKDTYTSLTKDNLKIVANTDKTTGLGAEIGTSNQDNVTINGEAIRNYEAAVNLNDGVTVYTLSVEDGKTVPTEANTAAVNEELEKISKIQYWNGGKTYYYVELEHNSDDSKAAFGVVRNHLYKLTLDGINGLGTPVPNPEKVIIPEKPGDDTSETYISAKIQILSYRVVSQTVTLQ